MKARMKKMPEEKLLLRYKSQHGESHPPVEKGDSREHACSFS